MIKFIFFNFKIQKLVAKLYYAQEMQQLRFCVTLSFGFALHLQLVTVCSMLLKHFQACNSLVTLIPLHWIFFRFILFLWQSFPVRDASFCCGQVLFLSLLPICGTSIQSLASVREEWFSLFELCTTMLQAAKGRTG